MALVPSAAYRSPVDRVLDCHNIIFNVKVNVCLSVCLFELNALPEDFRFQTNVQAGNVTSFIRVDESFSDLRSLFLICERDPPKYQTDIEDVLYVPEACAGNRSFTRIGVMSARSRRMYAVLLNASILPNNMTMLINHNEYAKDESRWTRRFINPNYVMTKIFENDIVKEHWNPSCFLNVDMREVKLWWIDRTNSFLIDALTNSLDLDFEDTSHTSMLKWIFLVSKMAKHPERSLRVFLIALISIYVD